jgi:hypothetical protein
MSSLSLRVLTQDDFIRTLKHESRPYWYRLRERIEARLRLFDAYHRERCQAVGFGVPSAEPVVSAPSAAASQVNPLPKASAPPVEEDETAEARAAVARAMLTTMLNPPKLNSISTRQLAPFRA